MKKLNREGGRRRARWSVAKRRQAGQKTSFTHHVGWGGGDGGSTRRVLAEKIRPEGERGTPGGGRFKVQ